MKLEFIGLKKVREDTVAFWIEDLAIY